MRPFQKLFFSQVSQLAALTVLLTASLLAQKVTTTAGGFVGDGGSATNAGMIYPRFAIQDQSGNLYISDNSNHRIRKVTPSGVISTFAGTGIAGFGGDGGLARNATLSYPSGILFDSAGNMLVSDDGNNRIRKIDTSGIITTIAGTGVASYSGDGGPALAAALDQPWALALDATGNLYFSDILNERVRKIDTAGIITTVAGNGIEGYSGDSGSATQASLDTPSGVAVDSAGNLYIADRFNHRVRKVDASGIITTFAGNGVQGLSGDGGPATSAEIGNPRGVTIQGNRLMISNAGGSRIRVVNLTSQIINTFAGSVTGFDDDGNPPLLTEFNRTTGMLFMPDGSLLVLDTANERLRLVTATGTTTIAGGALGDNRRATQASFAEPENLAFDSAGNYYIADWAGNRIRKVDASGQITTVAGNGTSGYTGDGGPATQAQINLPFGVAVDPAGNLFIADTNNAVIREVTASGVISTYVTDPNFSDLISLATDAAGNLYSADDSACVVRKITPAKVVSVVAGVEFNCGFNGDGIQATTALLNTPYGVAVDSRGNVYIGDSLNNRVRKVNRAGVISTVMGNGTCGFSGDGGPGNAAMICNPEGVAVDSAGNVYLGDYGNVRVRKLTSTGKISTIAGSGNFGYNGENLPATSANLDGPIAVGVDNVGSVFLLDDGQNRVRKIH